ncbi:hypothetical protein [Brevundimonas sp.]|uniref:hypothetical protein n=1 Tax=Brevundimonas sp. TaxID=1871086 RepID=UPI00286AA0F9|nr:hypothetical protein [Brevundimonas sp.]
MSHNPNMTSAERVLWRQVAQAAHEAAKAPESAGLAKALKKALSGAESWRMPDLRPLPSACFRAFLMMARGFAAEPDPVVRFALKARLAGLADAAGDILDGLGPTSGDEPRPAWMDRADLK